MMVAPSESPFATPDESLDDGLKDGVKSDSQILRLQVKQHNENTPLSHDESLTFQNGKDDVVKSLADAFRCVRRTSQFMRAEDVTDQKIIRSIIARRDHLPGRLSYFSDDEFTRFQPAAVASALATGTALC